MGVQIKTCKDVYEPREDSYLMLECVDNEKDLINSKVVVDVGCGTGIIGIKCCEDASRVVFSDINKKAVKCAKQNAKLNGINAEKIGFVVCDTLKAFKKAGVVVFNPPYLPKEEDVEVEDIALYGGERGNEVIMRFIEDFVNLKECDVCIFLYSTLSHPEEIESKLNKLKLKWDIIGREKLFFEEIFVVRVEKDGKLGRKNKSG